MTRVVSTGKETGNNFEPANGTGAQVRTALKDIFGAGRIDNYQSAVHGDLTMKFELRLDALQGETNVFPDGLFNLQYNSDGDTTNNNRYGTMQDSATAPVAGLDVTELITSIVYKDFKDSPFYAGQKLQCSYTTTATGAVADQVIKVKSVSQLNTNDANNGRLRVELDCNLVALAHNDQATGITVKGLNPNSTKCELRKVFLNMVQMDNPPAVPKQLSYDIVKSHRDGIPLSQVVDATYYIPPLCKGCVITFPEAGASLSKDDLSKYRVIINNEPITSTDIVYNSPKHYDLMRSAFANMGLRIKNMGSNFKNLNFGLTPANDNQQHKVVVIAFPVEFVNAQQVLQLELNGGANFTGNIQLNFNCVNSINL